MNQKVSSLLESYKITIKVANKKALKLKKSYLAYIASYITQGLAFAFFYPLLSAIFNDNFILNDALFWFFIIVILALISVSFKWYALDFNYSSDLTDVTHDIRVKLGNKIKTMPLQRLNKYRTGELNSILAQNVDDSVLHMGVVSGMALEATIVPIVIIIATFFYKYKYGNSYTYSFSFKYPYL